jgi:hypothetical protein
MFKLKNCFIKILFQNQKKYFSPRIYNNSAVITKLDQMELENLKELYNSLKEDSKNLKKEKTNEQLLDEDKNLIIVNTENTVESEFDKKITVNEIDWVKSDIKNYKIIFNESMAKETDKDLGYITFDEDNTHKKVPTYQEHEEAQKSLQRKRQQEELASDIIIDSDEKKQEVVLNTTKSYLLFPEQREHALRYYELLTNKGSLTQEDLIELEKIRPKYLYKYNSKPYSAAYIYKNFTDALEEMRIYSEQKGLNDKDLTLKVIVNVDLERSDHQQITYKTLDDKEIQLKRENIIELKGFNLNRSDGEIKQAIKTLLDNIYIAKPTSVVGRYFLAGSLILEGKEFHIDITKSAKSRNLKHIK